MPYGVPDSILLLILAALFGVVIGLVLNVVVRKLPGAIESAWLAQAREAVGLPSITVAPAVMPAGGRATGTRSVVTAQWRAGLIPGLTALVFLLCAWRYGLTPWLAAAMAFCAVLIALAFIDARTSLLPDVLTLPLMWLGLLFNSTPHGWASLDGAVWGAAAGYLLPWSISHAFRWVTGKEGMGYGDFKLFAALGAWMGWMELPWMMLAASVLGIIVALAARVTRHAQAGQPLPFGPYLAIVGIVAVLVPIRSFG